ncbi:hypothetical protein ACPCKP_34160, partial [Streptomyces cellulosae]
TYVVLALLVVLLRARIISLASGTPRNRGQLTWDEERIRANRRLLRVAITRARHMVVFVRPEDAVPLIPRVDGPRGVSGGA